MMVELQRRQFAFSFNSLYGQLSFLAFSCNFVGTCFISEERKSMSTLTHHEHGTKIDDWIVWNPKG
jgi:hypothetical protein